MCFEELIMNEETEREYRRYLDYMHAYETLNGYYPTHLSNGQWCPFSKYEYMEKTKNGTVSLNLR